MDDPNKAVDFLLKNSKIYAKAKAERVYLEEFRKSKKALLMQQAQMHGVETMSAQERDAYANKEYQELIKGLAAAVEVEEDLRWKLIAAQMRVDIWRTNQANNRFIEKGLT
tara:strand:+ start:515 stop:847 length:333 start_codon:yes stop_codon:yes gene_type:complete